MSLKSAYATFLSSPSEAVLSNEASLHYITTLTSFNDAQSIIKHLTSQKHQLKKTEEKIVSATESDSAVVVEVSTTLEFVSSGGAYLPNLDDNFLADRVVTFPIVS